MTDMSVFTFNEKLGPIWQKDNYDVQHKGSSFSFCILSLPYSFLDTVSAFHPLFPSLPDVPSLTAILLFVLLLSLQCSPSDTELFLLFVYI